MLRPNNNQLYSHYVSLLIPIEYLQYYLQYLSEKGLTPLKLAYAKLGSRKLTSLYGHKRNTCHQFLQYFILYQL